MGTKISPIPDSNPEEGIPTTSLEPRMFKAAAAKTHYLFSTGQQQDAQEYLGYLLAELTKVERKGVDPSYGTTDNYFQAIVEDKIQCLESKQVKLKERQELFLTLNIPLDAAINQTEVDEYVLITNQKEEIKGKN